MKRAEFQQISVEQKIRKDNCLDIITELEFQALQTEVDEIESLIGLANPYNLSIRLNKIRERLNRSRNGRITRAGFKIISREEINS